MGAPRLSASNMHEASPRSLVKMHIQAEGRMLLIQRRNEQPRSADSLIFSLPAYSGKLLALINCFTTGRRAHIKVYRRGVMDDVSTRQVC